jgi:protein disulfide-isomerase A6
MRVLILISVSTLVFGIYDSNTPVTQLNQANFDKEILRFNGAAVVQFYAPWCPHSKNMKHDFETIARSIGDVVKISAIDGEFEKQIADMFAVKEYPTIVFFGQDKSSPRKFVDIRKT